MEKVIGRGGLGKFMQLAYKRNQWLSRSCSTSESPSESPKGRWIASYIVLLGDCCGEIENAIAIAI